MCRILPATLALALAACGGGNPRGTSGTTTTGATSTTAGTGTGSGATTGTRPTADNFNQELNTAFCQFELRCQQYAPYIASVCSQFEEIDFGEITLGIDAGRVAFDSAGASACLAAFADGACSELGLESACAQVVIGEVAASGACYGPMDCQSGGCAGNDPASCAPGTCQAAVEAGGNCDCGNCGVCDAAKQLVCSLSSSTCVATGAAGASCSTVEDCDPGMDCIGNLCASVPVSTGDPCNSGNGECALGAYCFATGDSLTGNCALQVGAGQPCGEDLDHANNAFSPIDNQCAGAHPVCLGAGTLMDGGVAPGTCASLSDIGESCNPPGPQIDASVPYNDGCFLGLNCVGSGCARAPSSGPCSTGASPCDPAISFCASATNTCTPYIALGGTCDQDDDQPCGFGATCDPNNICQGNLADCSPNL